MGEWVIFIGGRLVEGCEGLVQYQTPKLNIRALCFNLFVFTFMHPTLL